MLGPDMKALLDGAGVPVIAPEQIAEGVVHALRSGTTGACFQCLPGRPAEPFAFGELAVPLTPTS